MTETADNALEGTTTARWMHLARAAAIATATWAVVVHLLARELIVPVLVIGLINLGFVPFLKGERRKLGFIYAAVTVLVLVGSFQFIIGDLAAPNSTPSFVLTLLQVTAAAVAVVSGLGAGLQWSVAPIRAVTVAWTAVFLVGTAVSAIAGATTASDEALPGDVIVVNEKTTIVPDTIEVQAGSTGFWVDNRDGNRHTFTVGDLGIEVEIPALKARRFDVDLPEGTYQLHCTVPGHETMTATLTVNS